MGRILFIPHLADLSGAQRALLDVMDCADRSRHEVEAVCPAEGPFARELDQRLIPWRLIRNPLVGLGDKAGLRRRIGIAQGRIRYIAHLRKHLMDRKPDIVFVNSTMNIYAGIAARSAGMRTVYYVHEVLSRTAGNRFKCGVVERCASLILAPALANAANFSPATQQAKFQLLPCAVDVERFRSDPKQRKQAREKWQIPPEDIVIGTACYITPYKGLDDLLRAAAQVAGERPDCRFLVVGSPHAQAQDYYWELQERARKTLPPDVMRFIPHQERMEDIYPAMDIFVLPSLTESSPLVILEAMAAGIPVIATAVGGVPEMITNGENGILIPARSPGELAENLIVLSRDKRFRAKMGAKAHESAKKRDLRMLASRVKLLFNSLMPDAAGAGRSSS